MIEKKINYSINIEKPSKTKPIKQGGVLNFLGKQKTVNAPVKWRSSKDHPVAHLAYITKDEEKILIDLNLYGSLKGKPNKGPFGLPSLQGSGGGAGGGDGGGGDGGDSGDSGDAGMSSADSAASAGFGSDATGEGGGTADAAASGGMGGPGAEGGFGIGPDAAAEAAQSVTADDVSMAAQAAQEDAATAAAAAANTGIASTVSNAVRNAIQNAINNPIATVIGMVNPVAGIAARAISSAVDAANRGVTGPSDDTQETSSVQTSAPSPSGGDGGITTLPQYAPLYNQATGDPLLDSLIARYKANLPSSSFGI